MAHHDKISFASIRSVSDDADTNIFTVQNGDPIYVSGIILARNDFGSTLIATVEMRDTLDVILGEIILSIDNASGSVVSIDIPFYAANGLRFEVVTNGQVEIVVFHSQPGA